MELQRVEHEKPFDGPTMLSIGNSGPPMLGIGGERFSLDSSSLSSRDSVASSPTRPPSPRHGADSGYSAGETSDREWSELTPIHLRTLQSGIAIHLVEGTGAEMHHTSWSAQNVASELLDTERAYVKDLKSLTEGYLYNLRQATEFRSKKDKLSTVFSNIEKIFDFNRNLLDTLEGCKLDPVSISECFINKKEGFFVYTEYCMNYHRAAIVVAAWERRASQRRILQALQTALGHALPLAAYLLKPVQRVLKYHLLLQKIVKHMEEGHKGAEMSKELALVQTAVLGMTEVAKHINEMKRHNENTQRVKEVQGRLVGWRGGVLAKYGELVKEGMLAVEGAPRECLLFLLTRVLLFIKIGGLRYECVGHILCSRLILIESVPERPLAFVVTDICKTKVLHTLQAQTSKEKEQWTRALKTLIAENHILGSLDEVNAIHIDSDTLNGEALRWVGRRTRRKTEPALKFRLPEHIDGRKRSGSLGGRARSQSDGESHEHDFDEDRGLGVSSNDLSTNPTDVEHPESPRNLQYISEAHDEDEVFAEVGKVESEGADTSSNVHHQSPERMDDALNPLFQKSILELLADDLKYEWLSALTSSSQPNEVSKEPKDTNGTLPENTVEEPDIIEPETFATIVEESSSEEPANKTPKPCHSKEICESKNKECNFESRHDSFQRRYSLDKSPKAIESLPAVKDTVKAEASSSTNEMEPFSKTDPKDDKVSDSSDIVIADEKATISDKIQEANEVQNTPKQCTDQLCSPTVLQKLRNSNHNVGSPHKHTHRVSMLEEIIEESLSSETLLHQIRGQRNNSQNHAFEERIQTYFTGSTSGDTLDSKKSEHPIQALKTLYEEFIQKEASRIVLGKKRDSLALIPEGVVQQNIGKLYTQAESHNKKDAAREVVHCVKEQQAGGISSKSMLGILSREQQPPMQMISSQPIHILLPQTPAILYSSWYNRLATLHDLFQLPANERIWKDTDETKTSLDDPHLSTENKDLQQSDILNSEERSPYQKYSVNSSDQSNISDVSLESTAKQQYLLKLADLNEDSETGAENLLWNSSMSAIEELETLRKELESSIEEREGKGIDHFDEMTQDMFGYSRSVIDFNGEDGADKCTDISNAHQTQTKASSSGQDGKEEIWFRHNKPYFQVDPTPEDLLTSTTSLLLTSCNNQAAARSSVDSKRKCAIERHGRPAYQRWHEVEETVTFNTQNDNSGPLQNGSCRSREHEVQNELHNLSTSPPSTCLYDDWRTSGPQCISRPISGPSLHYQPSRMPAPMWPFHSGVPCFPPPVAFTPVGHQSPAYLISHSLPQHFATAAYTDLHQEPQPIPSVVPKCIINNERNSSLSQTQNMVANYCHYEHPSGCSNLVHLIKPPSHFHQTMNWLRAFQSPSLSQPVLTPAFRTPGLVLLPTFFIPSSPGFPNAPPE
uniref:pleckstrin homology domain-containing family G member 3-like n=1 Tax=Myxine glutinosa TaxID=7769 RepID=UPI00358DDC5D